MRMVILMQMDMATDPGARSGPPVGGGPVFEPTMSLVADGLLAVEVPSIPSSDGTAVTAEFCRLK